MVYYNCALNVLHSEANAGSTEYRDLLHTALQSRLHTLHVRNEHGVTDTLLSSDTFEYLIVVSHLRHCLRVHEGGRLDDLQAALTQQVDQVDLGSCGHELLLVLQAISRGYLNDLDFLRVTYGRP